MTFPFRSVAGSEYTSDPSIAAENGIIGVVWKDIEIVDDSTLRLTLRFAVSTDHGQSFSQNVVIDSSGEPLDPSLFWKNGIFYVVWLATHRRTPSGPELDHTWFSYSRDSGRTFVPFVDAVPDDTNETIHDLPSIWVNEANRAVVVWRDNRWGGIWETNLHLFVSVGMLNVAKGDLNLDGSLTIADIVMELNAVFLNSPFPAPFETADGNCDGRLSSADISLLLLAAFLGTPFPCE